ncbi:MAG: hypothetical protein ACRDRB_04170 [Pseudonocardiaceae bacterium]
MSYTIVPASGTGAAIVSLDAKPPVRSTAGAGAQTYDYSIVGTVTCPINMPTTNFLPILRIPVNAIIKKVELSTDTAPSTSLTGSLGYCFSDTNDGTPLGVRSTYGLSGATPSIVSQSFHLYATDITTYTALWLDVTFRNHLGNSVADGFYVPSSVGLPLWQAMSTGPGKATSGASPGAFTACATNPGGFFDLCWFETTTGINTSAVLLSARVQFTIAAA